MNSIQRINLLFKLRSREEIKKGMDKSLNGLEFVKLDATLDLLLHIFYAVISGLLPEFSY